MTAKTKPVSWQLFYFKLFKEALDELEQPSPNLPGNNQQPINLIPKHDCWPPCTNASHNLSPPILTIPISDWARRWVPNTPIGGASKRGMPDRYRLFFRFASSPVQLIVYVWFNDEDTLRKAGSRTDVYEVFKRMLMRGEVPPSIDSLLFESRKP